MTKFEEKKKEAYEKASMKFYGNIDGSRPMRYLLNELENAGLLKEKQSLPVVPECVAEFITKIKKADNSLTFAFKSKFDECPAKYWNEAIVWRLNHPEEFARAWLDGYTVEKPQLFYLRDELTGQFLAKDNQFKNEDRYFFWNGADPLTHSIGTAWKLSFTQEEIDSMQTGSYEQIEVAE